MASAIALFSRRASQVAVRRFPTAALPQVARVAFSSTKFASEDTTKTSKRMDEYENGWTHMAEEFEVIEDMLKRDMHSLAEEDALYLKKLLAGAKQTFAVEAPDGSADWLVREELKEIQNLLDHTKPQTQEQRERLKARMAKMQQMTEEAQRIMAVDAPDGSSDADFKEELRKVQEILSNSKKATPEQREEIQARMARMRAMMEENEKVLAVDAPDGESDGHIQEELLEIQKIIDDAALHEDKEFVKYEHKMEDAVRKERARDPEHDW